VLENRVAAPIPYVPLDDVPAEDRVDDTDHVLRIHGVHSRVMRLHFDLHMELMRNTGLPTRVQRDMLAFAMELTRPPPG